MTDLRRRLQKLDGLPTPDLWTRIQSRASSDGTPEVPVVPSRPSAGRRVRAALLAAVVFGVAAFFAWHAFRPLREATAPAASPSRHGVWSMLHRSLQLPQATAGACPSSPIVQISPVGAGFSGGPFPARGAGPVYVVAEPASHIVSLRPSDLSDGWYGLKTIVVVDTSYRGPLLIRGVQLTGSGGIGFEGVSGPGASGPGDAPVPELRLTSPSELTVDWFSSPTVTYVRSAGCFAYQIDGTTFHEVIVFQARAR